VRFNFDEDQLMFRASVRGFLEKECRAEDVRGLWETETGRSAARWAKLAELGLLGILVPEEHAGLAMNEVDLVLVLEESGRAVLPEPIVETAAVAAPLIRDAGNDALAAAWLPRIAAGEATVTVGLAINPVVTDAHTADLLLLQHGDEVHAVSRADVELERQPCNDPSRRLFTVGWQPGTTGTCVTSGADGRRLLDAALDRAALGTAAQQLGVAQRLVDLAVDYAKEREQFG
jgi:alkylation response protein AidB-like acyl-CoA dehydrogenase